MTTKYNLSVLNDSRENLFFTLFSFNTRTRKLVRISENSEGTSNNAIWTYQWPVSTKIAYDVALKYYVTTSTLQPIFGTDISTANSAITISFPNKVFDLGKTIKHSTFDDLSDSMYHFHCTCMEASLGLGYFGHRETNISEKVVKNHQPLKGVIHEKNKWKNGQKLKIKFQGGSELIRFSVVAVAKEWFKHCNLKFDELDAHSPDTDADILIGFEPNNQYGVSWALIGAYCRVEASKGRLSMNLGACTENNLIYHPEIFNHKVLHEFGHALGLDHEHQNPVQGGLCISLAKVKREYAKMIGVVPGFVPMTDIGYQINFGLLENKDLIMSKTYDIDSVMNYDTPIVLQYNPMYETDGFQSNGKLWPFPRKVVQSSVLSAGDMEFIAEQYPQFTSMNLSDDSDSDTDSKAKK